MSAVISVRPSRVAHMSNATFKTLADHVVKLEALVGVELTRRGVRDSADFSSHAADVTSRLFEVDAANVGAAMAAITRGDSAKALEAVRAAVDELEKVDENALFGADSFKNVFRFVLRKHSGDKGSADGWADRASVTEARREAAKIATMRGIKLREIEAEAHEIAIREAEARTAESAARLRRAKANQRKQTRAGMPVNKIGIEPRPSNRANVVNTIGGRLHAVDDVKSVEDDTNNEGSNE